MAEQKNRLALTEEVTSVIRTVLPGATVMDLPSVISSDAIALTAFDASEPRSADELADALVSRLRSRGWVVDERMRGEAESETGTESTFHAAKDGLGGGAFSTGKTAVSFHGLVQDS
ncbi:hypothetical protein [Streptomyces sp. NPDC049915]|uniref:hypothetical protein n=1 Tax=Streptomyces sp. NPDC049915 TaxID=3155510 RepID=UPI0034255FE3